MDGKTVLAYCLIAALLIGAVWFAISITAKRRAFKQRQQGRSKQK